MKPDKVIEVFRPVIYEDAIQAAADTLRSGWIWEGPKVKEFEDKFAGFCGARHCAAVNSGTSALQLAFECLALPAGSKVLVSDISHLAAFTAIAKAGYVPVFADAEQYTGNISMDAVEENLAPDIRAICCTHIGGYPCDLDPLRSLAGSSGIPLVEDCAHAIGSEYRGSKLGGGTLCCFSFSFPKNITGIDGGAVLTDRADYDVRLRELRNLGMKPGTKFTESHAAPQVSTLGHRFSWNDVFASVALAQMRRLEEDNRRRAQIARTYANELGGLKGVTLPRYKNDRKSSYFFYPLFFERRDALVKKLDRLGVRTRIYFRGFSSYWGGRKSLPGAEWYGAHELTLPINAYITDEDIGMIIAAIREGW